MVQLEYWAAGEWRAVARFDHDGAGRATGLQFGAACTWTFTDPMGRRWGSAVIFPRFRVPKGRALRKSIYDATTKD
uniref:hypothetical protein n=1 Tax=Haladaptatus cibarius TaxID=453847 RepID=UPI0006799440|nr:hypothetical protein [Haladaptatus cibarius]